MYYVPRESGGKKKRKGFSRTRCSLEEQSPKAKNKRAAKAEQSYSRETTRSFSKNMLDQNGIPAVAANIPK